jgi:hypothetical protein
MLSERWREYDAISQAIITPRVNSISSLFMASTVHIEHRLDRSSLSAHVAAWRGEEG